MQPSSFYERLAEDSVHPTPAVVGPWAANLSHGSPPATLLVHSIARNHPSERLRIARVAFDFFGSVPVADLRVTTEVVRPGARIELLRGRLSAGGRAVMEASAWRVAAGSELDEARVPERVHAREVPKLPGPQSTGLFGDVPTFGYGEALEWRFVEGAFDAIGPATVYTRPKIPLFPGEEIAPLERLLLMVDSANGISAELMPSKYLFVPVELTVSVFRHPCTEWVGMHAETTIDKSGIGQTHAELFDESGYLGTALQTLFVAPR